MTSSTLRRLRQVIDLYVVGTEVVLKDGSPLWMQALNPFEHDTARNEAQIAKARITMALRDPASDETEKVRMFFYDLGLDEARAQIVDNKVAANLPKILDKMRAEKDWAEKINILERGEVDTAKPLEQAEIDLLAKLSEEYTTEVAARLTSERGFIEDKYSDMSLDELFGEYLEWYLGRRGGEIMLAEYRLHQVMFGARYCAGAYEPGDQPHTGTWDHSDCEGHTHRVFTDKNSVRTTPDELIELLSEAADRIEMSVREAKNSDRQGSSFDSSPLPSEAAESMPSIPVETPDAPPGGSSSPPTTPSPSWASVS